MDWSKEKVLVTGGGGFLGRHIINALLAEGCQNIRTLGRSHQPELEQMGVEVFRGDLCRINAVLDACSGRSVVFHAAAKAGVWGKRQEFFSINVDGTENIINACLKHNVPTLIYTSSPSLAYPPTRHIENIDESEPLPDNYLAYYPESKAIAEKKVLEANSEYLKTLALRPHLIWGPGDPHLLPRVLKKARSGRLRIIGDGQSQVDLTYVENAAAAHLQAAENLRNSQTAAGKAYFISDDQPVVLWDWLNHILKECDIKPVEKKISYNAAYCVGQIMEIVFSLLPFLGEPPMTRFVAGQLAFSHYFNISNAKKDFGYKPVIDPAVALQRTIDWLKTPN